MILYIIRHGDPDYAHDCLTEFGKQQAEVLADRLLTYGINKIYTSPMGRARETASALCKKMNVEAIVEPWAHEIALSTRNPEFGEMFCTNTPTYILRSEEMYDLGYDWPNHPIFKDSDAKEIMDSICNNSDEFLARHGYVRENRLYKMVEPNDDSIALFCHGGLGMTLFSHLMGIPAPVSWSNTNLNTTGVIKLWFQNYKTGSTSPRCMFFNDTSHLFKAGLLTDKS